MTPQNIENIFTQLKKEHHEITKSISTITDVDHKLFHSYLTPSLTTEIDNLRLNFEDSFEYIRMYFNSGRYQGFKFYDDENLIVFAIEDKKKPHFKLFKPLGEGAIKKMTQIISLLSSITKYPIHCVCLDNKILKELKKIKHSEIKNIKEFKYYIYDLQTLEGLRGNRWKNVRQKVTAFNKKYPKLKVERLSEENFYNVIHFIGEWRRQLLTSRKLSFSNLEKNKSAASYYSDKNDFKNVWATVYKLSGRVVSFQLLYRLGEDSAAHAIGMADTGLSGLAEAAQVDVWREVLGSGIRFVNDGASWRPGLDRYKRKFNPISVQKVFECKIRM